MARKLSPLEVHQVKLLMCEGFSQTDVARALDVSQGTVSKICLGDTHRDIPWPNPAVGGKLMRVRGVRSRQDKAQAQLASGLAEPPSPDVLEQRMRHGHGIVQEDERKAIEQAQELVAYKARIKEEVLKKLSEIEEKEEKEFKRTMTEGGGAVADQNQVEPPKAASPWEVPFVPWEEIKEKAPENSIVEALVGIEGTDDIKDITMQRAVGVVFHTLNETEWDGENVPRFISVVLEQLKQSQPVSK